MGLFVRDKKTIVLSAALAAVFPLTLSVRRASGASDLAFKWPQPQTSIRTIDGRPVVFKFGIPLPEFDEESGRERVSLAGTWDFRVDSQDEGETKRWWTAASAESESGVSSEWLEVPVPGVWDEYDGGRWAFYDGAVWYRKTFATPATWQQSDGFRTLLVFLGVSEHARVWLNGVPIAEHRGAYFPFAVDVTNSLRPPGEENLLVLRVARRPWGSEDFRTLPPGGAYDWWPYGGITAPVYLERHPIVSIRKLRVAAVGGLLSADVIVSNEGLATQTVSVRFAPWEEASGPSPNLETTLTINGGSVRVAHFEAPLPPGFGTWSPQAPLLHTATAELYPAAVPGHPESSDPLDRLTVTYGAVEVATSGSRLTLNGQALFLKGANWHADMPGSGSALTVEDVRSDLRLAQAAGINFIRLSHYPRTPDVYRYADSHGLLLMDELPNYWLNVRQMDALLSDTGVARAAAAEMVWNNGNHPSIVLWSLLNEADTGMRSAPISRFFIATLRDIVRQLDLARRPVTYASNHLYDDIGWDLVDVIGVNEYFGFFYGTDLEVGPFLDELHSRFPDKPILITEYGNWAVYGSPRETVQATVLEYHWNQFLQRADYVAGAAWWALIDYRTRHEPESAIPYVNTMGLLDRQRRPKEAYRLMMRLPLPTPSR